MKNFLLIILLAVASVRSDAQSTVQNTGFENWTMNTYLEPDNWAIHSYGGLQNTDAHSGNYAVTIHNWYYYGEGYLGNGYTDNANYAHYGTPYTEKPLYLTGYYKYDTLGTGNIADSAYGVVMLREYNTFTGMRDTVAIGDIKLGLSNTYKQFQITVNDLAPGVDPDSIEIIFVSCVESSCMCSNDSNGVCLYLTIDDLNITTATGVHGIESIFNRTKAAPNPFNNSTTIHLAKGQARSAGLYDIAGRKIMEWNAIATEDFTIYRDNIPSGLYLLEIQKRDETVERIKLVIE